ncbi:MAG: hypothetical protein K2X35_10095 [Bryobacteraceae bacterium]|nr:hypothetical protein [Bryobacteraceae bacterium]
MPDDPDSVVLRLTIEGMMHEASSDRGYFHALCEVRRQLEPKEIFLICFGTDKYVYPSPMQESMGAAELAYRTTLGKPALTADIVNIFDEDPACNPSTIEDQEYFHQSWLASL